MLENYFRIAFRNLLRNKTFSAINILGLSIGIASCLMILLYVQHEFSFDRSGKNYERTFRVAQDISWSGKKMEIAITPAKLGPALKDNLPEIAKYERVYDLNFQRESVGYKDKSYFTTQFIFADTSFFNFFGYHLAEGDGGRALTAPYSVVITRSMAKKFFGPVDPIGKIIRLTNWDETSEFTVTGVAEDAPSNSSLQFEFIASFSTLYQGWWKNWSGVDYWGSSNFYTYVSLNPRQSVRSLESKLPALLNNLPGYREETGKMHSSLFFQPIKDIHLFSHLDFDLPSDVNADALYILSGIAFFLLLIACVNFMNLSTARYMKRTKEIGVRKVMGAGRIQLARQFLGESIIMSLVATAAAITFVEILLPFSRNLTGVRLSLSQIPETEAAAVLIVVALATGILAGFYPATFLSSLEPTSVLKNSLSSHGGASSIRKGLVIFQFTISIALIISALLVQKQLKYIQNYYPGFNKNNLVVIPLFAPLFKGEAVSRFEVYRTEIEKDPNVLAVTGASEYPGDMMQRTTVHVAGNEAGKIWMNIVAVDSNYLATLGVKLASGMTFSQSHVRSGLIINESAQRALGIKDPNGKELITGWNGVHGQIVGVINDFNFESLRTKAGPIALVVDPEQFRCLICRIAPHGYASTLKFLGAKWKSIYPEVPFDYSFLDADLGRLYVKEERFGGLASVFSGLSIFVASLGLFGLASFSVEQRTKELGIRKVLGASVPGILTLVFKEYLGLIAFANLVAWPIAYYFADKWLQNFAYRTNISLLIFVASGALALLIALVTVSSHAIKAATANPVEALRYE